MENSSLVATRVGVVGVVVALPEELATLTTERLVCGECLKLGPQILIAYAGVGASNAGKAAASLIDKEVTALISWGCAAGLDPRLHAGDLVLPEQVYSEHQDSYYADKRWLGSVQALLGSKLSVSTGSLIESSRIVASQVDKSAIHAKTGADLLDMESAAVFAVGQKAGIACLAVRAIVDPVALDLPRAVVWSLNADGLVDIKKLLFFVLRHPTEIPSLIRLGRNFKSAATTLKSVAVQLNDIASLANQAESLCD